MQARFYVGIDWGSERHAFCVMDAMGTVIKECFVPNDGRALAVLAELIGSAPPSSVFIAVETRRLTIVEALVARGYPVFTINPKQSDRFRDRFSPAGSKDDRLDARVLASSLRTDFARFRRVAAETVGQIRLRGATRMRETLVEGFRASANRLREVVFFAMPTLLELCGAADEPWFWDLVLLVLSDENALPSDEALGKLLANNRKRCVTVVDIRNALNKPQLAPAKGAWASALFVAGLLIDELRLLRRQQMTIDKEIDNALASLPKGEDGKSSADIVRSLPGFGVHCTAVFLVEAGEALEAGNLKELRAIAGVAPVTQGTGKRQAEKKSLVVMRRAVNRRLRVATFHAAHAACRDPRFGDVYANQRASGRSHARALRAVGDRQLTVLVAMMRKRTTYDPRKSPPPSGSAVEQTTSSEAGAQSGSRPLLEGEAGRRALTRSSTG